MGMMMGRPWMGGMGGYGSVGETDSLLGGQPAERYPHRWRVVMLSWFLVIIGFLGLARGLSWLRLLIGAIGVYGSWPPCEGKLAWLTVFVLCNAVWVAGDLEVAFLVLAGDANWIGGLAKGIAVTEMGAAVGDALDKLVQVLHEDSGNALLFSVALEALMEVLTVVWGIQLIREIHTRNSVSLPFTSPSNSAASAGGRGASQLRGGNYFPGSGRRLGA